MVRAAGPEQIGELVGGWIIEFLAHRPGAVLGLANGSSPAPVYASVVNAHRSGLVSFDRARAVILDEYVGLPVGHPRSYRTEIGRALLDHVDLSPDALLVPDPDAADLEAECARFERELAARGGVDLQLLGIGSDGHIGFNEPGSALSSRTRVVELHPDTRRDNARFFDQPADVPRRAITQGVATILEARRIVIIATGAAKAAAVARAVDGPISPETPASALQQHPDVTWVLDEAAASRLSPRA